MALKDYISRDIHDIKLATMLTDVGPDEAVDPNTLTYDDVKDLPGAATLSLTVEFDEDELRGDGQIIDTYAKPNAVTGSFTGILDFEAVKAALGGRLIENPGGTSGKTIYRYSSQDNTNYFYLEGQVRPHNSVGDLHIRLWKVRLTGLTIEYAQQTYAQVSFDFKAIGTFYNWENPDDANDVVPLFFDIERNGARVAVNSVAPLQYTPADSTPPTVSSSTPAQGATGVSVSADIVATFSESMLASSLSSVYLLRLDNETVHPLGAVNYVESGGPPATTFTATWNPASDLASGEQYALVIPGGSSGVKDAAGNALVADVVRVFTTA